MCILSFREDRKKVVRVMVLDVNYIGYIVCRCYFSWYVLDLNEILSTIFVDFKFDLPVGSSMTLVSK
jgi:hypothetical protein